MRLDSDVARRLFGASRVARLATVGADGLPHLIPVTFAFDGDDVVSSVDSKPKTTTALRRLRNIAENPNVSLLADHYDEDWARLWWVRVDGTATVADRDDAALDALAVKYPPYVHAQPSGPVIRVRITRWRGWSAAPTPPTPDEQPGPPAADPAQLPGPW